MSRAARGRTPATTAPHAHPPPSQQQHRGRRAVAGPHPGRAPRSPPPLEPSLAPRRAWTRRAVAQRCRCPQRRPGRGPPARFESRPSVGATCGTASAPAPGRHGREVAGRGLDGAILRCARGQGCRALRCSAISAGAVTGSVRGVRPTVACAGACHAGVRTAGGMCGAGLNRRAAFESCQAGSCFAIRHGRPSWRRALHSYRNEAWDTAAKMHDAFSRFWPRWVGKGMWHGGTLQQQPPVPTRFPFAPTPPCFTITPLTFCPVTPTPPFTLTPSPQRLALPSSPPPSGPRFTLPPFPSSSPCVAPPTAGQAGAARQRSCCSGQFVCTCCVDVPHLRSKLGQSHQLARGKHTAAAAARGRLLTSTGSTFLSSCIMYSFSSSLVPSWPAPASLHFLSSRIMYSFRSSLTANVKSRWPNSNSCGWGVDAWVWVLKLLRPGGQTQIPAVGVWTCGCGCLSFFGQVAKLKFLRLGCGRVGVGA
eukprot:357069-Chlamydomonas_euryale.AAC.10